MPMLHKIFLPPRKKKKHCLPLRKYIYIYTYAMIETEEKFTAKRAIV